VVVLKSLVDGEMTLADGRRIVPPHAGQQQQLTTTNEASVIVMHPNFRLIVLANKPGWPFLVRMPLLICAWRVCLD
jgi:hypothetical protein